MTRCLSPVPPLAPGEVLTTTNCATIDVGEPVVTEPSNCACPDLVLDNPVGNFEFHYDRFWNTVGTGIITKRQYLVSLLVNKGGFQYDQIFSHRAGECLEHRLRRIEVQIFNRAGTQKVALVDYASDGSISTVHFDVDMAPTFGDGQEHWITIISFDGDQGDHTRTTVYVDDQQIGTVSRIFNNLSDFLQLKVIGNVENESLPFSLWDYNSSIEQCLRSGNYNGQGGCELLRQDNALKWDKNLSDPGLEFFNDDRVAVPKAGPDSGRVAYLIHPKMTGRVYWEVGGPGPAFCTTGGNANWTFGAAEPSIVFGSDKPGLVEGSWGLTDDGNRLFADGNLIDQDITIKARMFFCYDVQTRGLWIGWEDTAEVRVWKGGGEPGAGATEYTLFSVVRDLRIVFQFFQSPHARFVSSSARSCWHPAPPTFGYLT